MSSKAKLGGLLIGTGIGITLVGGAIALMAPQLSEIRESRRRLNAAMKPAREKYDQYMEMERARVKAEQGSGESSKDGGSSA